MRMAAAGLPVPPAFVLPTSWCRATRPTRRPRLRAALAKGIVRLETATGLSFGAPRRPLLVSVRSGAAVSMPGMMETVLDVGLERGDGRGANPPHRQSAPGLGQLSPAGPGLCRGRRGPADGALRRPGRGGAASGRGGERAGARPSRRCAHWRRRCWTCYRTWRAEPFPPIRGVQLSERGRRRYFGPGTRRRRRAIGA